MLRGNGLFDPAYLNFLYTKGALSNEAPLAPVRMFWDGEL